MTSQKINTTRNFCRPSLAVTSSRQLCTYFSQIFTYFTLAGLLFIGHNIKKNLLDHTYNTSLKKTEDRVFDDKSKSKK